jgi:hypothetical protein
MSAPLLTHRPDLRMYHALFCPECWALAVRRERHLASLDIMGVDREPTRRHIAIADRVHRMATGYFG